MNPATQRYKITIVDPRTAVGEEVAVAAVDQVAELVVVGKAEVADEEEEEVVVVGEATLKRMAIVVTTKMK